MLCRYTNTLVRLMMIMVFLAGSVEAAQDSTLLIQNPDARTHISLNGSWNVIVDPYENGFYNHRYEEHENGYYKNSRTRKKGKKGPDTF